MENQKSVPTKTINFVLIIIVLVLICLLMILPKEHNITRHIQATAIDRADYTNSQITLLISGTYRSSLLGSNSFTGRIEIEGMPVTNGEMLPVVFDSQYKKYGSLIYKNNSSYEFVGYIRMDKNASEVIICIFDFLEGGKKIWEKDKGHVIMYPFVDLTDIYDMLY